MTEVAQPHTIAKGLCSHLVGLHYIYKSNPNDALEVTTNSEMIHLIYGKDYWGLYPGELSLKH